jgi:cytochrome c oxidase assembly protein subunit 15
MTALAADSPVSAPSRRAVGWWLFGVALLVALMVIVGGLTRLTGSGLSITEWHPVTGVVPPLGESAWQAEFAKYQQIPQYRFENHGMSLAAFESIYWWEWTHRLLGRLIGAAFLLPFLYFAATGAIARRDWPRFVLLFTLGGLQGFVGWWMVESGLETRVSVSQYRLAIHLGVAIMLFGALLWTAFGHLLSRDPARDERTRLRAASFGLVALVYLQMLLGALVAGLHAGLIYNTWPSMDGRIFPEHALFSQPWWINFFANPGLAQFDHRLLAYVVAAAVLAFWIAVRRNNEKRAITSSNALLAIVFAQVALGIATLLDQAPLALAALHQATAVALFGTALWNAFLLGAIPFRSAPGRGRR